MFQRNIIASVFRVEVNQVGKLGEYMEGVGGKWVMYDSNQLEAGLG